jgi:predicted transcriptional regulator
MPNENRCDDLSRRERQIMDVVYRRGKASAEEVLRELADPPSYSAVRATLRILEEKGRLRHTKDGPRYLFQPTVPLSAARRSALQRLVKTFFDGSAAQAVVALLDLSASKCSDDELNRLAALIERARKKGGQ